MPRQDYFPKLFFPDLCNNKLFKGTKGTLVSVCVGWCLRNGAHILAGGG